MKTKFKILMALILVLLAAAAGSVYWWNYQKIHAPKYEQTAAIQTSAAPTVTPTLQPTPTIDPHAGKVQSTINGQWITPAKAAKRPYAVMINNIEYAFLHQAGTSQADIIYEALAEGGITRMMAIYQDPSRVKRIGSVRSARHYYAQFAYEWDAIYCHFGHTKYATAKIEQLHINNLSGLSGIGGVVYARDTSLRAPHNVFTDGKKLKKGTKALGYRTKANRSKTAKHFTFNEEDVTSDHGKQTRRITLPFSTYSTAVLKYDPKKQVYKKWEYNQKHMDTANNRQLAFKNVIVQMVEESNIDDKGYQTMEISNHSGKGYYITNGRRIPITWHRNESSHSMVYRTKSGKVLHINPGKTYIAVFPKGHTVTFQ